MKKGKKNEEITVILGEGSKLTGKFEFNGISRIDGEFDGEIESKDTLIVGETADIKAKINVGKLILEGKIKGDIIAEKEILILSTGKLYGNINTPALIIEKGAVFEGNSKMGKEEKIRNIKELKNNIFIGRKLC